MWVLVEEPTLSGATGDRLREHRPVGRRKYEYRGIQRSELWTFSVYLGSLVMLSRYYSMPKTLTNCPDICVLTARIAVVAV